MVSDTELLTGSIKAQRLNPYFFGVWSLTHRNETAEISGIIVLILIFLEYGL